MVWGPDSKQTGPVPDKIEPEETAPVETTGPGTFRLRDGLIVIAANIVGQFAGFLVYCVAFYLQNGGTVQEVLWSVQTDALRNHLVVVSGLGGYLMMLPWILHLWRSGRINPRAIGFRWPALKWFGIALGLFILLKFLSVWLMSFLDEATVEASYRTMDGIIGTEPWWAAGSALMVVIVAPLLEETTFRAALYQGLSRHMPRLVAAVIAVIGFAAIHVQYAFAGGAAAVVTTAQVTALGAVLMFLYMKSGSLWPGIAVHAVNNALTLAFLFAATQH